MSRESRSGKMMLSFSHNWPRVCLRIHVLRLVSKKAWVLGQTSVSCLQFGQASVSCLEMGQSLVSCLEFGQASVTCLERGQSSVSCLGFLQSWVGSVISHLSWVGSVSVVSCHVMCQSAVSKISWYQYYDLKHHFCLFVVFTPVCRVIIKQYL